VCKTVLIGDFGVIQAAVNSSLDKLQQPQFGMGVAAVLQISQQPSVHSLRHTMHLVRHILQ